VTGPATLRAARLSDAGDIARVHVETWRATYPGIVPEDYLVGMTETRQTVLWEASIERAHRDDTVLVAEDAGGAGIVGFGNCGRERQGGVLGGKMGEVFTLYVANDWQGRGIGRALLGGLFEGLHKRDLNAAVIWVLSANPARYFYEAMGGQRLAERREPFSGAVLNETAYLWPNLEEWLAANAGGEKK
jgi:ribosomal protein S18 acetylase RimI-like enzyme